MMFILNYMFEAWTFQRPEAPADVTIVGERSRERGFFHPISMVWEEMDYRDPSLTVGEPYEVLSGVSLLAWAAWQVVMRCCS